jgi:transcriptional regulator with XRE-family HTH domain
MTNDRINNDLMIVRRNRGLNRKQVAALLGYRSTSTVARHEQGKYRPSLDVLLQLEILYRTPIAYLYPQLYQRLRSEVRNREGALLPSVDSPASEEANNA